MFGKQFWIHLILTLSGLARVNYAMSYTESAYQKQEAGAVFPIVIICHILTINIFKTHSLSDDDLKSLFLLSIHFPLQYTMKKQLPPLLFSPNLHSN